MNTEHYIKGCHGGIKPKADCIAPVFLIRNGPNFLIRKKKKKKNFERAG
jgi:hypothetical protein